MRTFKKFLALVLSLLMLVGTGVGVVSSSAAAVEGDYTYALNYLTALDVFKGYGNGTNGANDDIQRYQMALLFARAYTAETDDAMWKSGETTFTDLGTGYANEVAGAIAFVEGLGIMNGYGNGKFGPYDGIKYQDALVMFIRALGYEEEGMVYPYSYIQKAIKLKLVDGISGVGYGDTLTRGETAQLIRNMLGTKIAGTTGKAEDGNTFLSANFKTSDKQMILVATQNVQDKLEGLSVSEVDVSEKEGSVVFQDAVSGQVMALKANASKINLPAGRTVDEFVGYAFTVVYTEDGEVIGAELNAYEEYENFGRSNQVFGPVRNSQNAITNYSLVNVNGTTYQLVDEISDDENRNYPQLVLYRATDDAEDVLTSMGSSVTSMYQQNNVNADTAINYAKLVMIDTDADGVADRAIFREYAMGLYAIKVANDKASGESTEFVMIQNYDSTNELKWHFIANYDKTLTEDEYRNQKYVVDVDANGDSVAEESKLDNLTITGSAKNGNVVVYDYNAVLGTLRIVRSAEIQEGRLTGRSQYFYKIDGKNFFPHTYGFMTGMPTVTSAGDKGYVFAGSVGNTNKDTSNALCINIVNDAVNSLATIGADEPNIRYATFGDTNSALAYIALYVKEDDAAADSDYSFVIIDTETWADNKNSDGYTLTLDEDNNILVYAITEAGGKPQQIKVSKIVSTAGVASGKLADAKVAFGNLQTTFGQTEFKNDVTGKILPATAENLAALFANKIFTVVSDTDGEYVLNLDMTYAEGAKDAVKTVAVGANARRLQIRNGISGISLISDDTLADYGLASGRIFLDENSTIVLVGNDGVVSNIGVPENVTFIELNSGDILYNVENDLLVIETVSNVLPTSGTHYYGVDSDGNFATDTDRRYATWTGVGSGLEASDDTKVYVAVSGASYGDTAYISTTEDGTAIFEHTYNGLLNLATLTVEKVAVKTTSIAPVSFSAASVITVTDNDDGTHTAVATATPSDDAILAIAKTLGYNFGYLTEVGDEMAIHIDGADSAIDTRPGVVNEDLLHGASETALLGGYTINTIYDKANDGKFVYEVVTSDENNKVFDPSTSYPCAYLYDAKTDSVDVFVVVK